MNQLILEPESGTWVPALQTW